MCCGYLGCVICVVSLLISGFVLSGFVMMVVIVLKGSMG